VHQQNIKGLGRYDLTPFCLLLSGVTLKIKKSSSTKGKRAACDATYGELVFPSLPEINCQPEMKSTTPVISSSP